jgi:hypothetical protein
MNAEIIGVGPPHDQAGRLQPVEQANERNRPDVEDASQGGLIDSFVPRQMAEDNASCAGHPRKPGAHLAVKVPGPQPASLVQQTNNCPEIIRAGIIPAGIIGIGIIRAGTAGRLQGPPGSRGLLHQMADGRFVGPVAAHELLHDGLGQELIERRLVGRRLGGRRAQGCAAVRPFLGSGRIRLHYSTTIV